MASTIYNSRHMVMVGLVYADSTRTAHGRLPCMLHCSKHESSLLYLHYQPKPRLKCILFCDKSFCFYLISQLYSPPLKKVLLFTVLHAARLSTVLDYSFH